MERDNGDHAAGHLPASGLSVLRSRNFTAEESGLGTDGRGTHQSPSEITAGASAPRSLSASRISRLSFLSTSSRSFTGGAKAVHVEGRRPETAMSTKLPGARGPPPPATTSYTAIGGGIAVQASQQVIDIISSPPEDVPSRHLDRHQAAVDAVGRGDMERGLAERFPFLSARKPEESATRRPTSPRSTRRADMSGISVVARQLYGELGVASQSAEASFLEEDHGVSREEEYQYHHDNGSLDTPSGPRSFPAPQPSHRQAQKGSRGAADQAALMLRAVMAWRGIVVAGKGMSKLMDAVRRHARRAVLSRSLKAWYGMRKDGFAELVMANAYQRVQLFELKLVFRFECIHLARCFLHWRSLRDRMRRARTDAVSADISRRASSAKACLWAWWIAAGASSAATEAAARMSDELRHRLCARLIRGWRREFQVMSAAVDRCAATAFEAWRLEARHEAHAGARAAVRRRLAGRATMGGFFESWVTAAVSASTPGLVSAFKRRRSSRRVLTAFTGWLDQVDVKLYACEAAHLLSTTKGRASLEWVMGGWRAAVQSTRLAFKLAFRVTVRSVFPHSAIFIPHFSSLAPLSSFPIFSFLILALFIPRSPTPKPPCSVPHPSPIFGLIRASLTSGIDESRLILILPHTREIMRVGKRRELTECCADQRPRVNHQSLAHSSGRDGAREEPEREGTGSIAPHQRQIYAHRSILVAHCRPGGFKGHEHRG